MRTYVNENNEPKTIIKHDVTLGLTNTVMIIILYVFVCINNFREPRCTTDAQRR